MPMGWNYPSQWNGYYGCWMSALRNYYSNPDIRLCPTANNYLSGLASPFATTLDVTFYSWGIMGVGNYTTPYFGTPGDYGSYGINAWAENPPDSLVVSGGTMPLPTANYWRKMGPSAIRIPSRCLLIACGMEPLLFLPTYHQPSGAICILVELQMKTWLIFASPDTWAKPR